MKTAILSILLFLSSWWLGNVAAAEAPNKPLLQVKKASFTEYAQDYEVGHIYAQSGECQVSPDGILSVISQDQIFIYDQQNKLLDQVPYLVPERSPAEAFLLAVPSENTIELVCQSNGQRIVIERTELTAKERSIRLKKLLQQEIDLAVTIKTLKKQIQKLEREKEAKLKAISRKRRKSLIRSDIEAIDIEPDAHENFELEHNKAIQEAYEQKTALEEDLLPLYESKAEIVAQREVLAQKKEDISFKVYDQAFALLESQIFPDNEHHLSPFTLQKATLVMDSKGSIYGVDSHRERLVIFDNAGELLQLIDVAVKPQLRLNDTRKIMVDGQDNIYLVQSNRVLKLVSFGYVRQFSNASSSLSVVGSVDNDDTWSGKIVVRGETRIEQGVTLTIDPGTTVIFADAQSFLMVYGNLVARGSVEAPVLFTSRDKEQPSSSLAGKIMVQNKANNYIDIRREVVFQYCNFRHMDIAIYAVDFFPTVLNCDFMYNRLALSYYIYTKDLDMNNAVEYNNITKNDSGVQLISNGPVPAINNNNIYENMSARRFSNAASYNFSYSGYQSIDLEDNYWGGDDQESIMATLLITMVPNLSEISLDDVEDDSSIQVDIEPFLTSPVSYWE